LPAGNFAAFVSPAIIAQLSSLPSSPPRHSRQVSSELRIEVIANGVGVSADNRSTAIEPFARLSPATAGTGLGLAIVQERAVP
jgi:signal transduction histidine kinase